MGKRWTKEEKEYVINNNTLKTNEELARDLNKSIKSIESFKYLNKIKGRYHKDLVGLKFGRWTVIQSKGKCIKTNHYMWLCECSCKNKTQRILNGGSLLTKRSSSCGCYSLEKTHKRVYSGTKDVSGQYFGSIKAGAINRKLEFNITIEYIQKLLEDQKYKCILSGIDISGSKSLYRDQHLYKKQTASLDRIDSSKGYIIGNVQWVHKDINYMKQSLSDKEFIELCGIIWNYNQKVK